MKLVSKLSDRRLQSKNYLFEMSIAEYAALIGPAIRHNEYQRSRVRNSRTVFQFLLKDLMRGCVIPPIVLAIRGAASEESLEADPVRALREHSGLVLILDGLQRTHALLQVFSGGQELRNESQDSGSSKQAQSSIADQIIRVEVYVEITNTNILYRMLTLNTGQTPMTLRHQIEMLYHNLSVGETGAIKLTREGDGIRSDKDRTMAFRDAVDGFVSFLERDELPIDRYDVLTQVEHMETVETGTHSGELFGEFLSLYELVYDRLDTALGPGTTIVGSIGQRSDLENQGSLFPSAKLQVEQGFPFGKSIWEIFSKSQTISGFGAALGAILIDQGTTIEDMASMVKEGFCPSREEVEKAITLMLAHLDEIKTTSKKIGNAQRVYFKALFRSLLNRELETFLRVERASLAAYRGYKAETL